jgi:hypothetical protein
MGMASRLQNFFRTCCAASEKLRCQGKVRSAPADSQASPSGGKKKVTAERRINLSFFQEHSDFLVQILITINVVEQAFLIN